MTWKFEKVAATPGSTAGLAWDGTGMLFSSMVMGIGAGQILRYDPKSGSTSVFRKHTVRTYGLGFGPDGALYGCQESSRRVVRFMEDGSIAMTECQINGKYHNQPTNLAVDGHGRIWFCDPHSPLRSFGPQFVPYLKHASILRLERDPQRRLWEIKRMTFDTAHPHAVALAPDEWTLYVAETDNAPGGVRELRAYPVGADDVLGPHRVLHMFGRDYRGEQRGIEGMCTDSAGNIVAVAGSAKCGPGPLVYVFAPGGAVLETQALPFDLPMNCAFGDDGLTSLYVTNAAGELWRAADCGLQGRAAPGGRPEHGRARAA
jgi:gluconolactonase